MLAARGAIAGSARAVAVAACPVPYLRNVGAIALIHLYALRVVDALVFSGVTVVGDDAVVVATVSKRGTAVAAFAAVRVDLTIAFQARVNPVAATAAGRRSALIVADSRAIQLTPTSNA